MVEWPLARERERAAAQEQTGCADAGGRRMMRRAEGVTWMAVEVGGKSDDGWWAMKVAAAAWTEQGRAGR